MTEKESNTIPQEATADGKVQEEFKEYSYRWVSLACFTGSIFLRGIGWSFYGPIVVVIQEIYDVRLIYLSLATMIYFVTHMPISFFFANKIFAKYGTKVALGIGIVNVIICTWIRCLINVNVYLVILSNLFGAISSPFFVDAPPKVSCRWFRVKRRAMSTSIIFLMSIVGMGGGYIIPSFFVDGDIEKTDPEKGKEQIFNASLFVAILSTVGLSICWIFYKDMPPTPPGPPEVQERKEEVFQNLPILMKNCNFNKLMYAICISEMTKAIFASSMAPIGDPFGFNSDDISYIGVFLIIFGLLGGTCFGVILQKTKKYKLLYMITMLGGTICKMNNLDQSLLVTILLVVGLYTEKLLVVLVFASLDGFFLIPIIPVGLEFAMEIAYPVGEACITGVTTSFDKIFSLAGTGVAGFALDDASKFAVACFLIVIACLYFCFFIVSITIKENLMRTEADKVKKQKEQNKVIPISSENPLTYSPIENKEEPNP